MTHIICDWICCWICCQGYLLSKPEQIPRTHHSRMHLDVVHISSRLCLDEQLPSNPSVLREVLHGWLPAGQMTLRTLLEESAMASIKIGGVSKHSEHRPGLSSLRDSRDAKCQFWGVLWDTSGLIPSGLSYIDIKSICLYSCFLYVKEHIYIGKRLLIMTWGLFSQYLIQYLLTTHTDFHWPPQILSSKTWKFFQLLLLK